MTTIKIDQKKTSEEKISMIADYFLSGKIVAYPSDTTYGLGCIATNQKAVGKLFRIKERSSTHPMLMLIRSYCQLKKYAFVSQKQDIYIREFWKSGKQATTFIFCGRGLVDRKLLGADASIALRMPQAKRSGLPKDDFLTKILDRVNIPIVSTSLNKSGGIVMSSVQDIEKVFAKKIDLVIDAGKLSSAKPSRIIDVRDMKNIKIIRK